MVHVESLKREIVSRACGRLGPTHFAERVEGMGARLRTTESDRWASKDLYDSVDKTGNRAGSLEGENILSLGKRTKEV